MTRTLCALAVWASCTGLVVAQQTPKITPTGFAADRDLPAEPEPVEAPPPAELKPVPDGTPVSQFVKPDSQADDRLCGRAWHGDDGEYLLWWLKSASLPPLITASRAGSVPALRQPNTRLILGDQEFGLGDHSGGRFTLGNALYAIDQETLLGLEGTYLFLGSRTQWFRALATPSSDVLIGRPFVDAFSGTEQAQTVAGASFASGGVTAAYTSRLQGAELNAVSTLRSGPHVQFDALLGFRYFEVDEGLNIAQRTAIPSGFSEGLADQFDGHNRFYGGQVGVRFDVRRGDYFVNFLGKVALGETYEVVRVSGQTVFGFPGTPPPPGGLLALPTNSGRFVREAFAVLPEFGIKAGYHLGDHARLFVGYSFLSLSDLARPADQIDRVVNVTQVPSISTLARAGQNSPLIGPAQPQTVVQRSDFWAHGLSVGMEFRY